MTFNNNHCGPLAGHSRDLCASQRASRRTYDKIPAYWLQCIVRVSFSKASTSSPPASHTAGIASHDIREADGSSLRGASGPEVARVVSECPAMVIMREPTHGDDSRATTASEEAPEPHHARQSIFYMKSSRAA